MTARNLQDSVKDIIPTLLDFSVSDVHIPTHRRISDNEYRVRQLEPRRQLQQGVQWWLDLNDPSREYPNSATELDIDIDSLDVGRREEAAVDLSIDLDDTISDYDHLDGGSMWNCSELTLSPALRAAKSRDNSLFLTELPGSDDGTEPDISTDSLELNKIQSDNLNTNENHTIYYDHEGGAARTKTQHLNYETGNNCDFNGSSKPNHQDGKNNSFLNETFLSVIDSNKDEENDEILNWLLRCPESNDAAPDLWCQLIHLQSLPAGINRPNADDESGLLKHRQLMRVNNTVVSSQLMEVNPQSYTSSPEEFNKSPVISVSAFVTSETSSGGGSSRNHGESSDSSISCNISSGKRESSSTLRDTLASSPLNISEEYCFEEFLDARKLIGTEFLIDSSSICDYDGAFHSNNENIDCQSLDSRKEVLRHQSIKKSNLSNDSIKKIELSESRSLRSLNTRDETSELKSELHEIINSNFSSVAIIENSKTAPLPSDTICNATEIGVDMGKVHSADKALTPEQSFPSSLRRDSTVFVESLSREFSANPMLYLMESNAIQSYLATELRPKISTNAEENSSPEIITFSEPEVIASPEIITFSEPEVIASPEILTFSEPEVMTSPDINKYFEDGHNFHTSIIPHCSVKVEMEIQLEISYVDLSPSVDSNLLMLAPSEVNGDVIISQGDGDNNFDDRKINVEYSDSQRTVIPKNNIRECNAADNSDQIISEGISNQIGSLKVSDPVVITQKTDDAQLIDLLLKFSKLPTFSFDESELGSSKPSPHKNDVGMLSSTADVIKIFSFDDGDELSVQSYFIASNDEWSGDENSGSKRSDSTNSFENYGDLEVADLDPIEYFIKETPVGDNKGNVENNQVHTHESQTNSNGFDRRDIARTLVHDDYYSVKFSEEIPHATRNSSTSLYNLTVEKQAPKEAILYVNGASDPVLNTTANSTEIRRPVRAPPRVPLSIAPSPELVRYPKQVSPLVEYNLSDKNQHHSFHSEYRDSFMERLNFRLSESSNAQFSNNDSGVYHKYNTITLNSASKLSNMDQNLQVDDIHQPFKNKNIGSLSDFELMKWKI